MWHGIFVGSSFCDFFSNLQIKVPAKKRPQTFFPQKFTPEINILSLYTDVALSFFSIIGERVGEKSVFYWFYIGYAHRSVVWNYVFPLNVLNKNENIILDLSGTFWKSQKLITASKKKTNQHLKKNRQSAEINCRKNFVPGAPLPVLSKPVFLFKNSLDGADEVGLFTVLPFFQRKLDRTRPSFPPPSYRLLPGGDFQMRKPRHTRSFFLASVNCIFWSHLGCSGWKANIFYPCRSSLMVLYSEKIHFKETKLLGTRLRIWEKKKKKKASEVSRAGFTPFFCHFFPTAEPGPSTVWANPFPSADSLLLGD